MNKSITGKLALTLGAVAFLLALISIATQYSRGRGFDYFHLISCSPSSSLLLAARNDELDASTLQPFSMSAPKAFGVVFAPLADFFSVSRLAPGSRLLDE